MTTGQDLVVAARTFLGEPYSTEVGRDDPNSGHKDCSGLIAAAYQVATGRPLGQNISVTIYAQSAALGLAIPYDDAIHIAGACLLIPEDPMRGWGPNGHIGFSRGDGFTVEATPPRVTMLPITFQPWGSHACLLPDIDYGLAPTPAPKEAPLMERTVHNSDLPETDGWWYFPPTGRGRASTKDEAFLLRGTGVPTFEVPGPAIVQALATREAAYPDAPPPGEPCPPGLADASNDELIAELDRRLTP